MSRKYKKSAPVQLRKTEDKLHVGTISSLAVTRFKMPKYNGFACRGGIHGDVKYSRLKEKNRFRKYLKEEGY